ncbi:lysophospholipase [Pleurocapsa sp. CCALA 161]|uniref:lipase/acyltransferase domain-containing protein n=1 Tax=Pleurocapsa sp. CCALA 161 TaxID=2107688 RepID=UPI000D071AAE|nr:alpha/beta hydrolase [Pleurocapsa sp. CCALA 161]PSB05823.1 lysophospholipase [Pleurocapsa sp. CCALA 161]
MINGHPEYLLFAQHGWADTGNNIGRLVTAAVDHQTKVIVPSLGLMKTFIRLEPLIQRLEQIATEAIATHPQTPIKIVGHSMGGLMWLEVLERNPQWWSKIHSFILLGSPVGGSHLARMIDPLSLGIGTAGDLGKNRRGLAEKIAQHIPTLSVASDLGMGTDGLVTVENTKFDYANWLLISDITHNAMRYRTEMLPIMQDFWANPQLGLAPEATLTNQLIQRLRNVPGMTDTDYRDFARSRIIARLPGDLTLHTWNSLGVAHIYLCQHQQCLYAGYVGLFHVQALRQAIKAIQNSELQS